MHRCFGKMDNCSMSGMLGFGDLRHFEGYIRKPAFSARSRLSPSLEKLAPRSRDATDHVDQEKLLVENVQIKSGSGKRARNFAAHRPLWQLFRDGCYLRGRTSLFPAKYRQTLRRASHRLPSGKREAFFAAQSVSPPGVQLLRTRVPVVGEERQNRMWKPARSSGSASGPSISTSRTPW